MKKITKKKYPREYGHGAGRIPASIISQNAKLRSGGRRQKIVEKLKGLFGITARKYTSLAYIEEPVADGNFSYYGRVDPQRLTFHTTQGTLAGTLGWFNNPASEVSSNYVLDTDGQLYAMLEEYYVPYTNGDWTSNTQCVTVECVDNGDPWGSRSDALYRKCAEIAADFCKYYQRPIDRTVIRGHREESSSHPNCPGNLDLDRIVREAQAIANPTPSLTLQQKLDKIAALCVGTGQIYKYKIRQVLQS